MKIKIIPAIDLKEKRCVRLYQGNFAEETIYGDPINIALQFKEMGFKNLHIIDLDGAKSGLLMHIDIIKSIVAKTNLAIQIGGGVRKLEDLKRLFEIGVNKVIISSISIANPTLVKSMLKVFDIENIIFAFDVKIIKNNPIIMTEGWVSQSNISLWEILEQYQNIKHLLCTDVSRDGTLKGGNLSLYRELIAKWPNLTIYAAGGISSIKEINILEEIGIYGVIIGRAFYEKKLSFKEIF